MVQVCYFAGIIWKFACNSFSFSSTCICLWLLSPFPVGSEFSYQLFCKYLLASRFSRLFYNFSMNNVCLYCGTKSFFAAFAHYQFAIAIMHLWLLLLFTMQGEEQQTVDGLLHSLGLGKYAILFKAEEVCYSTPSPPKKKKKKLNALLKLS